MTAPDGLHVILRYGLPKKSYCVEEIDPVFPITTGGERLLLMT